MALFIVVPLTLTLKKWCAIPVNRLIIFEALAVNAGSLLTPIGNPQNILLWGRSGLSFVGFIGEDVDPGGGNDVDPAGAVLGSVSRQTGLATRVAIRRHRGSLSWSGAVWDCIWCS